MSFSKRFHMHQQVYNADTVISPPILKALKSPLFSLDGINFQTGFDIINCYGPTMARTVAVLALGDDREEHVKRVMDLYTQMNDRKGAGIAIHTQLHAS